MPWSFQHNKDLQHTCCITQDWARTCEGRLQSQLSVLGYLYGFLTPVKGLHDFASISGLAFLGVAFLPVHSPRMLWVIGAAWFYTCLPLASHCLQVTSTVWMLWAAWFHAFLAHFCHFSPPVSQCAVGALSRMNSRWSGPPESKLVSLVSHLSPTVSKYAVGALGRIILHLYRTCLWMLWAAWFCVCTPLVSHLFLTAFLPTLVARLPTAWLPLSRSTLWVLWAAWVYTCLPCSGCFEQLHLSPSCLPLPGSALVSPVGCLVLRFRRKVWMSPVCLQLSPSTVLVLSGQHD